MTDSDLLDMHYFLTEDDDLGDDFRIDLLFFHRGLQCLVAFELKIGKFKPEYISKMDFYLEALISSVIPILIV